MEKETDEKRGARNIGLINVCGDIVGSLSGLALGSLANVLWVNHMKEKITSQLFATLTINSNPICENTQIDKTSLKWVGAWWLPTIIFGAIGLVFSFVYIKIPDKNGFCLWICEHRITQVKPCVKYPRAEVETSSRSTTVLSYIGRDKVKTEFKGVKGVHDSRCCFPCCQNFPTHNRVNDDL